MNEEEIADEVIREEDWSDLIDEEIVDELNGKDDQKSLLRIGEEERKRLL